MPEASGQKEDVRLLGFQLSSGFRRVACHALRSNRLWAYATGLAVLLAIPAIWVGWQGDDHLHRLFFAGGNTVEMHLSGTSLFDFLRGDPETAQQLMDLGALPWWTLPELRISFWRPMTSLTHLADYTLWPDSAPLMHAHSLVWFALLVALVVFLYRRFMGATWVAGLAALLFAVDEAHATPVGWLANRNALVAGVFAVLTLLVHDRWRKEGWRPGAVLAPMLLALSLLSAEMGVATAAYLLAYALFLEEGDWRKRASSLLSYAAVASVWLGMYRARGHGTLGSGFYLNPLSETAEYLKAATTHLPVLLLDLFGFPPASPYIFLPTYVQDGWVAMGVLLTLLIAGAFLRMLQRDRIARFFAVGCALSLLPVSATVPHSRLLLFSSIGALGLVAQYVEYLVDRPAAEPNGRRLIENLVGVVLLLVHVVAAPLLMPVSVWGNSALTDVLDTPALEAPLGDDIPEKTVVIVNAPVPFFAAHFSTVRALAGVEWPRRLRVLAPGMTEIRIERIDRESVKVTPAAGFLSGPFDEVFRGRQQPMESGEIVELAGMSAIVNAVTSDGRPSVVTFRFDRNVDDPSFVWLRWMNKRLVPMGLPAVGDQFTLAQVPLPFGH